MMQTLSSLGILSLTNSNQMEIRENVVEKVTGGTSVTHSFSSNQGSVEPSPPNQDSLQRLEMMMSSIESITMGFKLSHDPLCPLFLNKTSLNEFIKGDEELDETIMQFWCS